MDKMEVVKVEVTSGELYPYLKGITLVGRIAQEDKGNFIVYGCIKEDEEKFYNGILKYDKDCNYMGFETVEEVVNYWTKIGDLLLTVANYDYRTVD